MKSKVLDPLKYLLANQETERLTFRLLTPNDFDAWIPLFRAENSARFLELDPSLSETELCQAWFDKQFHRYQNDLGGMNVLIEKESKGLVGQCGILVQTIDDTQRLEIGYSILPEFWKNGYASEAAAKCKSYAFENNFAETLISVIHVDNISSEKVAIRNGMAFEKKMRNFNIFSIDRVD